MKHYAFILPMFVLLSARLEPYTSHAKSGLLKYCGTCIRKLKIADAIICITVILLHEILPDLFSFNYSIKKTVISFQTSHGYV